jgi:type I site-specific restriction-modification system R (restriction) subunit
MYRTYLKLIPLLYDRKIQVVVKRKVKNIKNNFFLFLKKYCFNDKKNNILSIHFFINLFLIIIKFSFFIYKNI